MRAASILQCIHWALYVVVGFIGGGVTLWQGQWLRAVILLSLAVAAAIGIVRELGYGIAGMENVGLTAVGTVLGGLFLVMVRELFGEEAYWTALATVLGVTLVFIRRRQRRRLPLTTPHSKEVVSKAAATGARHRPHVLASPNWPACDPRD